MKLRLFFSFILLFASAFSFAQFEGTIKFIKITPKDTLKYIYYIKGDKVRIDNIVNNKIKGTSLIDLNNTKKYTAVSHIRKMYMDVITKKSVMDYSATKAQMTSETKDILGYKCKKWIITNPDIGTTAVYWMAPGEFDFFMPLLKVIKRKEDVSQYLLQVGDVGGYFPIESYEEKDGVKVTQLITEEIKEEKIKDSVFAIPANYKFFGD